MNRQKLEGGVSLVITFFIMIIILSVVLSISTILYTQLKNLRNTSNSVISYYAAESGVEKVLYYDKKVLPVNGTTTAARGLCWMLLSSYSSESNSNYCQSSGASDAGIYCNSGTPSSCNPDVCGTSCETDFTTSFDGESYTVKAISGGSLPSITISSVGSYGGTSREIDELFLKWKNQKQKKELKN
jgi:hypothetical protein